MADSGDIDRHLLPVDSIKLMGEAIGMTNINEDAAMKISEDLEYRLKELLQDSGKFMRHAKRKKLISADLDMALKVKNVEPLYGFDTDEYVPFRHTSGGGKDLFYQEEQDLGLLDLVSTALPRLPCDVSVRAHWLSVEGVQPLVPENPPPTTIYEQLNEAAGSTLPTANAGDPASHLKRISFDRKGKKKEDIGTEWSKLKHLQAHALSTEQQLYYKEISDACIGIGSEAKWQEALNSLSSDPGIYQLLPQFTNFIIEGIRINIAQGKLMVLKHLVKMVAAILDNSSLSLEKYLHELIPSLLSAAISRQLCLRPEAEDHWSLRDSIGKTVGRICRKYSSPVNNIQARIQRVLLQTLKSGNDRLAAHYGAICCLVEMGPDSVASLVIPTLSEEAALIRTAQLQQGKSAEHAAANKLQALLLRHCVPIVMAMRPASDTLAQYQADFGSLGQALFNQVKTLKQNRVGLQSMVTARVSSPTSKSSPPVSIKNKPPPLTLSLSSSQIQALRASTLKLQSPATSAPTLAAALQLVTQVAKSNPATPTAATPSGSSLSASLLSAVISSPGAHAALTEHLTAALSGAGNGNGDSSPATPSSDKSPKPQQ